MIATSAPLLTSLREKGSTFYTLSSFLNDIDKSQMNSNIVVTPSRFVCLNLPTWRRWANDQVMFEEPEHIGPPLTTDPNLIVPKMIQNYMENALALSYTERVDDSFQTISESLFWKMLIRMGAMRVKKTSTILKNGEEIPVYSEDMDAFGGEYKRVVTYASDINVLNHITKVGQSYTEIFMHIPSQAALLEKVHFVDPGFEFQLEQWPQDGGPNYTVGLEDHPESNTYAVYDTDDKKYDFTIKNRLGLYWDEIEKSIDPTTKDFEFNAILVYYDIWNREDTSTRKTNLAGILFLDKFTDTGAGSYTIDTLDKYVPNAVSTGNGYAVRLNIKTTSNQSQTTSEISINDYNSVSMELYMTALQRLNNVTDLYEQAIKTLLDIKPKVDNMYSMMPRITTNEDLQKQIDELKRKIESNQQTYRISNEDLFTVFSNAVEATKKSGQDINIQLISGNYIYDPKDGLPIVVDPDNKRWKWNETTQKWDKML